MTGQTRKLKVDQRFELELVLDGTQDFRWRSWKDGWLSGVLAGHLVHVRQVGDILEYRASEEANLDDLLRSYFRLDEDVETVHKELSGTDDTMAKLVNRYPYLRILRQPDPWQATVSYICSANNRIKRTSDLVERIACMSDRRTELDGDIRYAFPTPGEVLKRKSEIEEAKLGLHRGSGIIDAAQRECDGRLPLGQLQEFPYLDAKRYLEKVTGIGPKVADCIALFALDKGEAFPVDTWVQRALDHYYPQKDLHDVRSSFGKHAGYASQLLFREART